MLDVSYYIFVVNGFDNLLACPVSWAVEYTDSTSAEE